VRRALIIGVLCLASCTVCKPAPGANSLCLRPDGGLAATVIGGNSTFSGLGCAVSFDGGLLRFSVSGTECDSANQNDPIVTFGFADCDVSAYPPGRYAASIGTTITLPPSDAGFMPCPG
jgi:hypothetical protein